MIKTYIKTILHCLWRGMLFDINHRIISISYSGKTEYFCSCSKKGNQWSKLLDGIKKMSTTTY